MRSTSTTQILPAVAAAGLKLRAVMLKRKLPDLSAMSALIKEISEAAIRVLDADPDNVRIVINEVTADDWGVGGVPVAVSRAKKS